MSGVKKASSCHLTRLPDLRGLKGSSPWFRDEAPRMEGEFDDVAATVTRDVIGILI